MKNNQTGRSMVEMLGVLAIIGILSAGALKGYSDAMFKYKMNKTIDEAIKILQRFEEINGKDWGASGTEDGQISIYTGNESAVNWGFLEKCNSDGNGGCRLPIGSISIEFWDYLDCDCDCVQGDEGHHGAFIFNFTDAKSCTAFASVHWEQILPSEWWNPEGKIMISGEYSDFLYYPAGGMTTIQTTSDIADTCKQVCVNGNCSVWLVYRSWC